MILGTEPGSETASPAEEPPDTPNIYNTATQHSQPTVSLERIDVPTVTDQILVLPNLNQQVRDRLDYRSTSLERTPPSNEGKRSANG